MKVVEVWKNFKTGKNYQVRQYEEKEVWVDLGCGWFESDYGLEYIQTNKDFKQIQQTIQASQNCQYKTF